MQAELSTGFDRYLILQCHPVTVKRGPQKMISGLRSFSTFRPARAAGRLTHVDPSSKQPTMVSVHDKQSSLREATAVGRILLPDSVIPLILESSEGSFIEAPKNKGPVLSTARLAAIMAAKRTSDIIPLCHPLLLDGCDVSLNIKKDTIPRIDVSCTVRTRGPTGVEMEALTAVSAATLTIWDMLKAVGGQEMEIEGIKVVQKKGGKSGAWERIH